MVLACLQVGDTRTISDAMMFRPGGLEGLTSYSAMLGSRDPLRRSGGNLGYHLKKANERCPPPLVGLFWYQVYNQKDVMESDPTLKTIIFSPIEMIELERLGVHLPVDELPVNEVVAHAYDWRQRARAAVETAEQQYDGASRQSQNNYQRAQYLAGGLTVYANMVVDAYPMEYLGYLQKVSEAK